MKKIYFLIAVMLFSLSIHSSAQPNYFFYATTKPYVPVINGIVPPLKVAINSQNWETTDEGLAQKIPIGFTFKYEDRSYEQVNASINGFVILGDTFTLRFSAQNFQNRLASGPPSSGGERPVLAPFWDDLALFDTLDFVYKTTGVAPFRVFTVEWKKVRWTWDDSTDAVLSVELKLYETTNVIEFDYKDEGGMPYKPRAFASIGITSANYNKDFISVQSTSAYPKISLTRSNDSLSVKPANNQAYLFVPSLAKIPNPFSGSITYTNKKVSFKLSSDGLNNYEYAVTRSFIPPSSGIRTFSPNITVSSLDPATTYYIYARTNLFNSASQWVCDSFTTASNPVELPYHVGGNPAVYPYVPADMRTQEIRDTAYAYYPNSDETWNVFVDFPHPGDTSLWALNTLFFFSADNWIFTPGLKLKAGKTYQLKFGYLSYYTAESGAESSIEVKYGKSTGAAGMTSSLFKKAHIKTNKPYDEFGGLPFKDTVIEITPDNSGVYYFGFHNLTQFTGEPNAIPVVGNISISEKMQSSAAPFSLNGKTNNTDNILSWIIDKENDKAFEVQRSTDGTSFTKISIVNFKDDKAYHTGSIHEIFKTHSNTNTLNLAYGDKDNSIKSGENNDGVNIENIALKTWIERMNLTKNTYSNSASLNAKTNSLNDNNYVDRKVDGVYYYRLQQTDKKGNVSFSNIIKLGAIGLTTIYPNPVKDILYIKPGLNTTGKITIQVTNIAGEILINKQVELFSKTNVLQLNVSHLTAGTYILKISCDSGCENVSKTFIKQ